MSLPLRSCLLLALLACTCAARAEWFLKIDTDPVRAGAPIDVTVFLINDTREAIEGGLPARLPATLLGRSQSARVTLTAVEPPATLDAPIPVGGFRKQRYRATLPPQVQGTMEVVLDRLPAARVAFAIAPESPLQPSTPAAAASAGTAATGTQAAGANVLKVDSVPEPVLSPHEPMYLLVGTRDGDSARFQLSFKYRLFDERGWLARMLPGIGKLHFGYTQTSLWDLDSTSAPFRDTSYRPSLFWYDPQVEATADGRHLFGMEGGLEHESNGRDGVQSRSINVAYARPSWRWFVDDDHYVGFAPKLYAYLDKNDNPDLHRYRGYGDYNLRFGRRDGWLLSATLRKGTGPYGSFQLDASWPIRQPFFADAGGFIHLQYFNGYGETLLDYNLRRGAQFRVGFSIVR